MKGDTSRSHAGGSLRGDSLSTIYFFLLFRERNRISVTSLHLLRRAYGRSGDEENIELLLILPMLLFGSYNFITKKVTDPLIT